MKPWNDVENPPSRALVLKPSLSFLVSFFPELLMITKQTHSGKRKNFSFSHLVAHSSVRRRLLRTADWHRLHETRRNPSSVDEIWFTSTRWRQRVAGGLGKSRTMISNKSLNFSPNISTNGRRKLLNFDSKQIDADGGRRENSVEQGVRWWWSTQVKNEKKK